MKNILTILFLGFLAVACDSTSEVDKKKEELKEVQTEMKELKMKAAEIEEELAELDSTYGKVEIKKTLITSIDVVSQYFEHKVETRGTVESRKNVTIGSEIPGKVETIFVKEGQQVTKGQRLLALDSRILRNTIAELETSLELATTVFERQSNLWEKNIGTEIQYLESKNKKESLERKLATTRSQLAQANITAPFNGSIDEITAKEGEIAQPGMPLIRIVNPKDVYIKADASERFIGVFEVGDEVDVYYPAQDKKVVSTITSVGQVINSQNRTFEVEIAAPKSIEGTKPNQVVILDLRDYINKEAIVVPTMIIQKDNKGAYIYRLAKEGTDYVAKKAHITAGVSYDNSTEILSGLKSGEKIAYKGFRDLSEGTIVSIANDVKIAPVASQN